MIQFRNEIKDQDCFNNPEDMYFQKVVKLMQMVLSSLFFTFWILFSGGVMALTLTSLAFENQSHIPRQYACDGEDISPPLVWGDAPEGTLTYVLIMEDPDAPAGTWVHWLLYNIPATVTELPANVQQFPPGTIQGNNSWGNIGYGGPCPPSGTHRYVFKLYALNNFLNLPSAMTKDAVEMAMEGKVIGQAVLTGLYQKQH